MKGGRAEPFAMEAERSVKREMRWWDVVKGEEFAERLCVWVCSQVGGVEGVEVRVEAA